MWTRYLVLLFLFVSYFHCHNNGLARTPPMGWNSWNQFYCDINEDLIKGTIDTVVSTGLKDAGYIHVNIDDCWEEMKRNEKGELVPHQVRFSHGIKSLADYAHSRGVKLGIYSDVGLATCQGRPGSYDHYEIDAKTFADWGIDYLKLDFCNLAPGQEAEPWKYYSQMSKALNATGRPIVYSICNWGYRDPFFWAPSISNLWRTTGDIENNYESVVKILDLQRRIADFSGPGAWNDPDMLEVGVGWSTLEEQDSKYSSPLKPGNSLIPNKGTNGRLSPEESKTHFSLWCMLAAPLILGNDIRHMPKWVYDIITNKEAIAINQDVLGIQAKIVAEKLAGNFNSTNACTSARCTHTEVWARPLDNGAVAVLLFNRGGDNVSEQDPHFSMENIEVTFAEIEKPFEGKIKMQGKGYRIHDVWKHADVGFTSDVVGANVAPHAMNMFVLTKICTENCR